MTDDPYFRGVILIKNFGTVSAILLMILFYPLSGFSEQQVKVGFIGGFSGPGKSYGDACKNGFMLGLGEPLPRNISVIFEDDQFSPAKTVASFKKLTEIDKVDLAIVLGSGPSNSIAPIAEQKKIPLIAWGSDPKIAIKRSYVFRSWVSGQAEGVKIAETAIQNKYNNVAFITVASDYARSVAEGFQKTFPHSQLRLIDEYPADSSDFKAFLLKLKSRNIEALGVCLNPGQPALIAKQAKGLGLDFKIFGCETLHDKSENISSSGALNNAWFVTGKVSPLFTKAYRERFGNEDMISGAAVHYDIARSFVSQLSGEMDGSTIAKKIRNAEVTDGAMGNYKVSTTNGDQFLNINLILKKITHEGFESLNESS